MLEKTSNMREKTSNMLEKSQRRNNYITKHVHLTDNQKNLIADGFFKK